MQEHGTETCEEAGRLVSITDRTGHRWATLVWGDRGLVRLVVPGAAVDGAIVRDPLLGDAHVIASEAGQAATTVMSALDWAAPAHIPTVAAPGRLAPGAGGAIINAIAVLAQRANVKALRYAGPYPTHALWRALERSFRTEATADQFTADLMSRMARLARDPIAIDFVPAPCERVAIDGGFVELRGGIERVVLAGISYEPGGSPARIADGRCEIWFGDAVYAHVATIDDAGTLVDGPSPIPRCTSDVIGKQFPPALAGAIAELVAETVPAVLAGDARSWLAGRPITWADLGGRAARATHDGFEVHAALWERIGPLGLGRLALALAEALTPVVAMAIVAALSPPSAR